MKEPKFAVCHHFLQSFSSWFHDGRTPVPVTFHRISAFLLVRQIGNPTYNGSISLTQVMETKTCLPYRAAGSEGKGGRWARTVCAERIPQLSSVSKTKDRNTR